MLVDVVRRSTGYRTAGAVHQIDVEGIAVIGDLLAIPEVLHAARSLALGQMRKGRPMFGRFHNDLLAEEVFARLSAD